MTSFYYTILMWKENRVKKWILSFIKKIDEHFIKYEIALKEWNEWRIAYYNREIEFWFFGNIDKAVSQINIDTEIAAIILDRKKKRHEIKVIPLS